MITDKLTLFTAAGATGNVGTNLVGDVIDLKSLGGNVSSAGGDRDIGLGQTVYLIVMVATGIKLASSTGTYLVKLSSSTTAAFSGGTQVDHVTSPSFATSTTSDTGALAAGTVLLNVAIPQGTLFKQYLGIREVVGTTNTSAGKIKAFLTTDPYGYRAYPQADIADETSVF